jgi:hypothetical protein
MRVVLVADNASSKFGGEAFIPLNYFRLLRARGVEAWLVVHERNRSALTDELPEEIERVYFVEDNFLHKALFRVGKSCRDALLKRQQAH